MVATTRTDWDQLRDRLQSRFLADLPGHIDALTWDATRIAQAQRVALRGLLSHAAEHSPFHARRLAGIDPDSVDPDDLSALPVMTKAEMMAAFDDVVTDRRLHRGAVEEALASTGAEPVPLPGSCLALASGGSSGLRGVFVLDAAAVSSFFGAVTRSAIGRWQAAGIVPPGGLPVAFVAAGAAVHATGCAAPLTAGGALPMRAISVPATLPFAEIVARLEAIGAPGLYGYPAMLGRLAAERRAGRLRLDPMFLTTTGETLTPALRAAISGGFEAPVVDVFGSTEGLAGATAPDDDVFVVNSDMCIVELVDDDGLPVSPGTPSTRVLLTNLRNRVQPLIRYELTDRFVQAAPDPAHGHLRARVRGRRDATFRFGGLEVPPGVVRSELLRRPEIVEYQVFQRSRGIAVDVVTAPGATPDLTDLEERLATALARTGLAGAVAQVRSVPAVGRDARTGKLRRFVPLSA